MQQHWPKSPIGLAGSGRFDALKSIPSAGWLDLAKKAGVQRLIINGSFVMEVDEPNDVDCVLLVGSGFPRDSVAADELVDGLPFVDLELVEARDFAILVEEHFATDRDLVPKGVVEVVL